MNELRKTPLSFLFILLGILGLPAICYGTLQYLQPSQPDKVFTQLGSEKVEWSRLTGSENYSEYIGKDRNIDEDGMVVNILVMRNFYEPQTEIMNNVPVTYSSKVLHEPINCRNKKIMDENVFVYSKNFAKGEVLRAIIGTEYEPVKVSEGTVGMRKVLELCSFGA